MVNRRRRVLVVEDHEPIRRLIGDVLPGVDAPVFRAAQLDLRDTGDLPILLISATWADRLADLARDLGAAAWLAKPFDVDDLVGAVDGLMAR